MIDLPDGVDVLAYLGWPSDSTLIAQADVHAAQAATVVKAYTRGRGFNGQQCAEDVAAAVISYAGRTLSNPTAATELEAGSFRERPGSPWSFSLLELLVLNEHRRRAG